MFAADVFFILKPHCCVQVVLSRVYYHSYVPESYLLTDLIYVVWKLVFSVLYFDTSFSILFMRSVDLMIRSRLRRTTNLHLNADEIRAPLCCRCHS